MKAFPKVKRHRPREVKDVPPVKKTPGQLITGNVIYYITQNAFIYLQYRRYPGLGNAECETGIRLGYVWDTSGICLGHVWDGTRSLVKCYNCFADSEDNE